MNIFSLHVLCTFLMKVFVISLYLFLSLSVSFSCSLFWGMVGKDCCYMQIDLQEIALPPVSFQFAVIVLALWLPEKLLWKATDFLLPDSGCHFRICT